MQACSTNEVIKMKYCTKTSILTIAIITALSSVTANGQSTATVPYGDGEFEVGLTPISNKYCIVNTTGECGGQTVEVEVLLEDENADYVPDPGQPAIDGTAWENTIFAGGTLSISGSVGLDDIDGTLHANNKLQINGGASISPDDVHLSSSKEVRVNGQLQATGSVTAPTITLRGPADPTVTVTEQEVPQKAFPEYNLTGLYYTAQENGQIISGNVRSNADLNWDNVPGGVVWVEGSVSVTADANINCTLIATGDISIAGNANWGKAYDSTRIISRDGTIRITGNTEVNGLLYAPGDITLTGTAKIVGQVVSGSDVTVNGDVEIINYTYAGPDRPGIDAGNPLAPSIKVGAWQK